jgi:hypothetical protein
MEDKYSPSRLKLWNCQPKNKLQIFIYAPLWGLR